MKAIVTRPGGDFVLTDTPAPTPGPGQIQARITAASLNPMDLRLAAGDYLPVETPLTLGTDFSGTITDVGAGVTAYRKGDEIFGHAVNRALAAMAGPSRPSLTTGALAEYAVFEADTPLIAKRPQTLDPIDAAALPTAGMITRALLTAADPQPGHRILIIGATGGVGTTLLPELRQSHVIATAHPGDSLKADTTIGYDDDYPTDVDLTFNLAVPTDRLRPTGGRLFTIVFPATRGTFVMAKDVAMADVATLTPTITGRYPLDDGVRALHDFRDRHTVGKLVIEISPRRP